MLRIAIAAVVLLFSAAAAHGQAKSSDYTADYQQTALEIYRHTISIRSAAGHGKVPEVAHYLADQFRNGGFSDSDIHVLPQTLSSGEEAASLVRISLGRESTSDEVDKLEECLPRVIERIRAAA